MGFRVEEDVGLTDSEVGRLGCVRIWAISPCMAVVEAWARADFWLKPPVLMMAGLWMHLLPHIW